jgi:cation:H+ antiporter
MHLGDLGWFIGGLVLLLLGGDSMVKGVSGFAQSLGVVPHRAGLYLLAFATSIPELAVNAYAIGVGQPDLALGNAVGSNIVNIGLTLGVAAVAAPLVVRMRLVATQVVLLLVAGGAVLLFGLDGTLARWEGGVLLAGFAGLLALYAARIGNEEATVTAELAEYADTAPGMARNLVRIVVAGAVLYLGARWIVGAVMPADGHVGLAAALGFGPLLAGLLVVAIGTAVPEAAMAVIAARAGQGNVVAGHVLGASLFNFLLVLGGMAVIRPLALPASFVTVEVPAAMAFALALYPLLAGDLRLSRRDGGVLLGLFVLWVGYELVTVWA